VQRSFEALSRKWAILEWQSPVPSGWERVPSAWARRVLREASATASGRQALARQDVASLERGIELGAHILVRRIAHTVPALEIEKPVLPQEVAPQESLTWVEIQLLDLEGLPMAGERYEATLPDGSTRKGELDDQGIARLEDVSPPGTCHWRFPDLHERYWQYGWAR
jgi:hypothetical protein